MNNRLKQILPHIYVVLAFLVITFIYFSPLLEGKVPNQTDNVMVKGMARELMEYKEKEGRAPLWTNAEFSGMPAYQIWMEYPSNIASYLSPLLNRLFPNPSGTVLLYLLGAYLLFCTLRMKPLLSAVGAVVVAFVSYNFMILEAGHSTKAIAIAYFAPIIAGVLLALRGRYLTGTATAAFFLALEIRANHLQMTYYLMLAILVLIIVELIYAVKRKTLPQLVKGGLALLGGVVIAVGVNFGTLSVNYEYAKDTLRGKSELTREVTGKAPTDGLDKEYAYEYSMGIGEVMTFLVPNVYGGSTSYPLSKKSDLYKTLTSNQVPPAQAEMLVKQLPALGGSVYWGELPFTSGPYYFGAIAMFLFISGLFILRGPEKWWLLSATVLVVLLSFGGNLQGFSDLFFDYFPFYNKFRAVSSILAVAGLTVPLLAMLALKKVLYDKGEAKKLEKGLKYSLYISGGLLLILLLVPDMFYSFSSPIDAQFGQIFGERAQPFINALESDRKNLLRMDALRSLVFILIAFACLWAWLKQKMKAQTVLIVIGLAMLVDLWTVDKRIFNNDHFVTKTQAERPFPLRPADQQIMQDTSYYRVYDRSNRFYSSYASYYHHSVTGYNAARLKRYEELIQHHLTQNNQQVFNMLNTKYFIVPGQAQQGRQAQQAPAAPQARLNPGALGNTWFVDSVRFVADADEEIQALDDFKPGTTAIVDERFREQIDVNKITGSDTTEASISLTSYHPEHLSYEYTSQTDRVAVFSEIYYDKGWKAYVDGEEHPYFRTDYVLRGMQLPAGTHTVEFKFHPRAYYAGEKVSLVSSILLILLLGGSIFMEIRKKKSVEGNQ